MSARKQQAWMWLPIMALLLLGIVYHFSVVRELQSSVDQLSAKLDAATGTLDSRVTDIGARTAALDERLNGSVVNLTRDIEMRDERSLSQIQDISDRVGDVQKQSDEIVDQIDHLNIRSEDFSSVATTALSSVVSIITDTGQGSGAIVDPRGYIVTNHHVIEGIQRGAVKTHDEQAHTMRIVATDETHDLALIRIESDENLRALAFEQADNIRTGMRVIALGSPAGLEFTVTEGIVSAVRRENAQGVPYIQTDVPINPGNSGGPLLDIQGKIIGINSFKARGYEGLGFAIGSDIVEEFVREAIAEDEARQEQAAQQ